MTNGGNFTNTQRGSLFSNEPDGAFGNYDGSFSNVGGATLRNSGGFYNGAFFTSSSLLVNSGADSLLLNESGALLVNSGAGSRLLNESGALLANQGLIRNSAEFVVRTEARVDGNGTYLQTAGVTTANGFIVQGTFDCQGGTVNGAGHISAPNLSIGKGCSVDPGNSPGTLTLDGGAAGVEFDGILNIEIAGLFDHDVLRVLSGGIHFDAASLRFLFEGYEPAVGDGFDFLDGAFDGTFSFSYEGLREGYQFELARNALGHLGLRTLAVPGGGGGSVPLPGTVVLALLGLGALRLLPTGRARSLQRSCAGA